MANISVAAIRALREATGAPLGECRRALEEASGDPAVARKVLADRGAAVAAEKSARATSAGSVGVYVHNGGRIGALVLLRCETDFVAKSAVFQTLVRDLAMQVAAMNPSVLDPADASGHSRPKESALLAQPFIKDPAVTIRDLLASKVLELGENIHIDRFARFAV